VATRWQQRAGTWTKVLFTFRDSLIGPFMTPTKLILHRQGNPGAEGKNGMAWGNDTSSFSIHYYVDDTVCFVGVPENRQAYHTKDSNGQRADLGAIGIETEDESPASASLAPGQTYGLSQDTRITLVLVVCDIFRHRGTLPVFEHADFDNVNRKEDLGNALYLPDFRLDVEDALAGREPWRTVGVFATGAPAPDSWKPVPAVPAPTTVLASRLVPLRDSLTALIEGR
jgi:hypothetical protein